MAINNEPLSGKPVSFVRNVIRSVPRGEVQLLLQVGTEEEVPAYVGNQNTSPSTQRRRREDNDADSFVTTTTTAMMTHMADESKLKRQLDEPDPTEFALPLPSKYSFSSKINGHFKKRTPL